MVTGIKDRPPKPDKPCGVCGSDSWWWREPSQWGQGEWLCDFCHPDPNKYKVIGLAGL